MKKKIAYWVFHYMPQWEAASKEVASLRQGMENEYDITLIAIHLNFCKPVLKGREKHIPFYLIPFLLPFWNSFIEGFDCHHIFASPSEHLLLPLLNKTKTVLTVTKEGISISAWERNLRNIRKANSIVVESEQHKEILSQLGFTDNVRIIYPGMAKQSYCQPEKPFKILFASSPRARHDFLSRGLYLLLNVAKKMPQVRFVFVWRNRNLEILKQMIRRFGVTNIEIQNGVIDNMSEIYDSVHASIIPAMAPNSFKPCPHSALNALSHGKPILVSRNAAFSSIISKYKCGVVFEPAVEDLELAIRELQTHYNSYQANCDKIMDTEFSGIAFLERYRELYRAVVADER